MRLVGPGLSRRHAGQGGERLSLSESNLENGISVPQCLCEMLLVGRGQSIGLSHGGTGGTEGRICLEIHLIELVEEGIERVFRCRG